MRGRVCDEPVRTPFHYSAVRFIKRTKDAVTL